MVAVSDKPWGRFSESDYSSPGDYCKACLIDLNDGSGPKTKDMCKLPVKEPNGGPLNRNGVHAAAQRLGSVSGVPTEAKAKAARMLLNLYVRVLKETPPDAVKKLAKGA